ncbi:Sm protein [Trichomonas vaginalis G3]|uniref:Small nuclear ribonucleoprotein Sm D2 n=1 Tax=Trichomonas vaginalis (strain ATCC PRA-98 / G3) TaxID=412133 RepID=A2FU85_TRIV3|nr:spliceosomal snRNP assembly [Trichomonas vaginalis G3]EAX91516.1 Sm protein [Trichomonas vaginalis G3]KAI5537956.1 spliceosomal snRNP assembly [Trichomonas vaginalis G3]|eukprot:XP_001304446.1 Sm protein [Trichomonas vaginalis G3]
MTEDPQPEDSMEPSEMTNLQTGPMAPIVKAVYDKEPLLIALRSNRKLYGYIKAVDRHWNMILEHVIEITPTPAKPGQPAAAPIQRRINRLFLRGDNVICIYPNPKPIENSA